MTTREFARLNRVGRILSALLLTTAAAAQQLPHEDAVRIAEFYRLASQIQDQVWADWSKTPAPLLLVTDKAEFLFHDATPPKDFVKLGDGVYARPRQFDIHLLATFPAFGPPATIVIGQAQNTDAKTSTPWLITLMHEHFHQLQDGYPGYYDGIARLGLSGKDTTGMWMLNYPFPYERPEVVQAFTQLRDLLLNSLAQTDSEQFKKASAEYAVQRKKVFAQLSPNDHKYLSFQLWQEGIARYTQIKAAEAAGSYRSTAEYEGLPDYESFAAYAKRARAATLDELRQADIGKMKRSFVYPFGAAEGLLLDRLNPAWESAYFTKLFSTDALFE
ncbi:MAG TPA: hypothetical protein VK828_02870 [Terriglobales bacterium]|jgi:hypothetical protein|nr:hypothetical protein [Terriglobales bacterium]